MKKVRWPKKSPGDQVDFTVSVFSCVADPVLDLVVKIERECYRNPWNRDIFASYFSMSGTFVIFCWPKINGVSLDTPVGFFAATHFPNTFIHLASGGVVPSYRRCGAGRALLNGVDQIVKESSRSYAKIVIQEYDVTPQLFLRACGWKCVNSIKPGVVDGAPSLLDFRKFNRG